MRINLLLAAFCIAVSLNGQTQFTSTFNFTDTTIANQVVTLRVYGDSIVPIYAGAYYQNITGVTDANGSMTTSVSVPSNIDSIQVSYVYTNCYGTTIYTSLSGYLTTGSNPIFSEIYCGSVSNCNLSVSLGIDSSDFSGNTVFGRVWSPSYTSNATYTWDMGDGTLLNGRQINHTYTTPGNYSVQTYVVVQDANGATVCTDTVTSLIDIPQRVCNASHYVVNMGANKTISVYGLSFQGNYTFEIDNTVYTSNNFTHTLANYGSYPMKVIHSISNANGSCSDTVIETVNVQPGRFNITGRIENIGSTDTATIYLIESVIDTTSGNVELKLVDSKTKVDSGFFRFSSVLEGTYYLKAALNNNSTSYGTRLPTYHGDKLLWTNATPINHNGFTVGKNINMLVGVNPGGPGFISGFVHQGANKKLRNNEWDIILTTDQDVPVACAYADSASGYQFSNLDYGTYKVQIDIPGSAASPYFVTLDSINSSAFNIDFIADSTETAPLSISEEMRVDFKLFPSPTSDVLMIQTPPSINENLKLIVFNTLGQRIFEQEFKHSELQTNLKLSVSGWEKGVYLFQFSTSKFSETKRVVKK